LAQGFKDDPDTLPWLKARAQSDDDSDVRSAAVQELAQNYIQAPRILVFLIACFLDDQALQPEEIQGCNRRSFPEVIRRIWYLKHRKFEVLARPRPKRQRPAA
jgi:hypothetical protein